MSFQSCGSWCYPDRWDEHGSTWSSRSARCSARRCSMSGSCGWGYQTWWRGRAVTAQPPAVGYGLISRPAPAAENFTTMRSGIRRARRFAGCADARCAVALSLPCRAARLGVDAASAASEVRRRSRGRCRRTPCKARSRWRWRRSVRTCLLCCSSSCEGCRFSLSGFPMAAFAFSVPAGPDMYPSVSFGLAIQVRRCVCLTSGPRVELCRVTRGRGDLEAHGVVAARVMRRSRP